MGYCKVIIIGNLTRDPELRFTPKGLAVAKLSIAINRTYTANNEKKEEVTFVDVDCFGKQAETIAQYLKKGSPLFCEGRLKLDTWDDKTTGQKRSKLGVVLETFQFIGVNGEAKPAATSAKPASDDAPPTGPQDDSEGVPF